MFKNYFLIAVRSLKKDKINALTSLFGLIIGLVCVILISGYIHFETSFDKSYSNANRIYRIVSSNKKNDYGRTETVPAAFGPTLLKEIPGIEGQTHINTHNVQALLNNEYADFMRSEVDSSFFSLFNFSFIYGNPKKALNSEDNIVLTESAATKYFQTTDVVGKSFVTKEKTFLVSGVIRNVNQNSFLQSDAFVFRKLKNYSLNNVKEGYVGRNAFVLLKKEEPVAAISHKIKNLCHRYEMDDFQIELQPVQKIYLHSSALRDKSGEYKIGDIKYVYIYGCIAVLILVIGCINFINLSIARSIERTKEVGMRKVLGASKNQLITQFLGESFLYFAIAYVLAIGLATILWKEFTLLSNIQANQSYLLNMYTLLIIAGICIVSSSISGIYPSLFLTKLQTTSILKNNFKDVRINFSLRKALVVIQFSISIILVVATLVVHSQLSYLNNKSLGFNKNNLVRFEIPSSQSVQQAFMNKILQNPNIEALTFSSLNIGKDYSASFAVKDQDSTKFLSCVYIDADVNFLNTLQTPIQAGRNFSSGYPSDIANYDSISGFMGINAARPLVVSESFVKTLNIKDPIGKVINKSDFLKGTIIGVIKDFNVMSLKDATPLLVIRCNAHGFYFTNAFARINGSNTTASINHLKNTYKQFFPEEKFDFTFIDERIKLLYDTEIRLTKLSNIFSFLAIALSCMGLFALSSLIVRKRTKEIGIRKVMGASINKIVIMIAKDFMYLLIVAFFVSVPVSYIAVSKWLQGYANRTEIYWWIFAVGGVASLLVALLTVSIQTIKAATANPVKSLRSE